MKSMTSFTVVGISFLFMLAGLIVLQKTTVNAACADLGSANGLTKYTLTDVEPGNHAMWLRVKSSDGSPSLRYSLSGGGDSCDRSVSTSSATSWQWIKSSTVFSTTGGSVQVQIAATKANVGVDCFVLTSDNSFTPSGSRGCAGPQVDETPPTLRITAPAENATIKDVVSILASVNDNESTISQVGFFVEGRDDIAYFDREAPYTYPLDTKSLPNGQYKIIVVATNINELSTAQTVNVTVNNTVNVPSCDDAAATNTGQSQPCVYPQPEQACEDTKANNIGQPLPCTYDPVDAVAPSIQLTSPINSTIPASTSSITISAEASDNVRVNRIDFFVNKVRVRTDSFAPYTVSYSLNGVTARELEVYAIAYDDAGNAKQSNTVTIIIEQTQPLLLGDVNDDGVVSLSDMYILVKNFNKTGVSTAEGDLNGDGQVTMADVFIVRKQFGLKR